MRLVRLVMKENRKKDLEDAFWYLVVFIIILWLAWEAIYIIVKGGGIGKC